MNMFDFEKLEVYKKAKDFHHQNCKNCISQRFDRTTNDQLRRASYSIPLNIAGGTTRLTKADKRHFYIIARGSVSECVCIYDLLLDQELITREIFNEAYKNAEEISRML